jgi:alpha-beta hydrolase superfamily lysophospholipase
MTQAPAQAAPDQAQETRQRMKDGTELLVRTWLPDTQAGEPRGTVILVHGMAEHSGRYVHVAKVLTDLGLRVRAFDLRGHGRSGGPRMALDAPDNYLTDLAEIVDAAVAEWHEMPFVLGHSMGGLIVARFTTARVRPVRGVLLSSPALRVASCLPSRRGCPCRILSTPPSFPMTRAWQPPIGLTRSCRARSVLPCWSSCSMPSPRRNRTPHASKRRCC